MSHPFPDLQDHPLSGLSFPWAFYHPEIIGNFEARLGPDGVGTSEVMIIWFRDLEKACVELLGYSYQGVGLGPGGTNIMKRVLPWQHPYFNQLFIKSIASAKGVRMIGNSVQDPNSFFESVGHGQFVGVGQPSNFGPWTEFDLCLLTLQFWRPPYFVRSDASIIDGAGSPQEWLRYVDKVWSQETQMLSREGCQFNWTTSQGITETPGPPGAIGTPVTHLKLTKRWYQIPEACLFERLVDDTRNGEPSNQTYMRTATTNPITGYTVTPSAIVGNAAYHAFPIVGTVNSPKGGGVDDSDATKRFFGTPMGCLRLDGVEFIPRDLQLPPSLMQIANFDGNEPISQQQYDVVFHFDRFDPPRTQTMATSATVLAASTAIVREACRGHNLFPWAGNGLWYALITVADAGGGKKGTPFNYSDFTDLFRSL